MTDTALLKSAIKRSGFRKEYIAEQLGFTRATLSNKINNKSEFLQNEILVLCRLLNLSHEEKEQIFFADNVGK